MSTGRKILVATDFSEHAQEAFRVAHDLAKARGRAWLSSMYLGAQAVVSDGDHLLSKPAGDEATDVWD